MPKDSKFQVRVEQNVFALIKARAAEKGLDLSSYIRNLVAEDTARSQAQTQAKHQALEKAGQLIQEVLERSGIKEGVDVIVDPFNHGLTAWIHGNTRFCIQVATNGEVNLYAGAGDGQNVLLHSFGPGHPGVVDRLVEIVTALKGSRKTGD